MTATATTENAPCCTIPEQHTQIHPRNPPADPSAGTLIRIVRQPHRAYPICHVRAYTPTEYRHGKQHPFYTHKDREPYPWCEQSARWQWNEQTLCDEHAVAFALGFGLPGIFPDGRWCRRDESKAAS